MHDLVALGLQRVEQIGRRLGGKLLKIVHEYNAFAVLLQPIYHRLDHLLGPAKGELEQIEVGREHGDIALGEILLEHPADA